jgi:hypothetical protein
MNTKNTGIRSQVKHFRTLISLLLQVRDHGCGQYDISQLDMIEAFQIIERVTLARLSTNHKEWKGDAKNKYRYLFASINKETTESIQNYFTVDNGICKGFIISKFNTLVLDSFFGILQSVGPTKAYKLARTLCTAAIRDIHSKPTRHQDDAIVAQSLLVKFSRGGISKITKKILTKKQRMLAIKKAVFNVQAA